AVVPLLALVVVGITLTDFFDPVDLALLAHGAVLATAERDTTGAAGAAGAAGSADAARAAGAAVGRILVVSAAHAEHATGQRQHQRREQAQRTSIPTNHFFQLLFHMPSTERGHG